LTFYVERKIRPRPATDSSRVILALLSNWFPWREALVIVKPETLLGWHRRGFRLFWKWKSKRPGRPRISKDVQALIQQMAANNPTWGQERIAAELLVKLGLCFSPRTIRRYMGTSTGPKLRVASQRWQTFVRNHAKTMVASDFFVAVTASFRVLYVFVVMEIGTRRILHFNVTAHPTAEWTLQQFREVISDESSCEFVIHDRDSIYSSVLDSILESMGVKVLKTPFRSPQANGFCERLIGSIRRECLDFMIPLTERHLRRILKEYVTHYNRGRPHSALGPGVPQPEAALDMPRCGRDIPKGHLVEVTAVLGGLHHEYRLAKVA
jgi:putative transposase